MNVFLADPWFNVPRQRTGRILKFLLRFLFSSAPFENWCSHQNGDHRRNYNPHHGEHRHQYLIVTVFLVPWTVQHCGTEIRLCKYPPLSIVLLPVLYLHYSVSPLFPQSSCAYAWSNLASWSLQGSLGYSRYPTVIISRAFFHSRTCSGWRTVRGCFI